MASKEIKKIKNDWMCFAEWYDLYWFHSPYIYGFYTELKKYTGYTCKNHVWEFKKGVQRYYISQAEWDKNSKKYFKDVLDNPLILEKVLKKILQGAKDFFKFNKKIIKINFSNCSWEKIIKTYEEFHKLHYYLWCVGMAPNLLELNNTLLSSYLIDIIYKSNNSFKINSQEIFKILTTPQQWSFAQKQEYDFLSLVIKHYNNRNLKNKLKSQKSIKKVKEILKRDFQTCWKDINKYYQSYYWIPYNWTGPAWDIDYFVRLFKKKIKESNLKKKIKEIKQCQLSLNLRKEKYSGLLKVSKYNRRLFRLMNDIIYCKIRRMDALYQSYCFMEPVLKRIAKEFNVSLEEVRIFYGDDMIRILKDKVFPIKKAKEMLKYSVYKSNKNGFTFYTGEQAKKIMKSILSSIKNIKNKKDLSGKCGCPGRARGRVKIVTIVKELKKMKQGDVLVSQMTNPSLVPAMKKASAIVCDMGGLTCHAAIISRELDIPCVIGTKIATRVLKDGDLVEVDATKGVVKKIR